VGTVRRRLLIGGAVAWLLPGCDRAPESSSVEAAPRSRPSAFLRAGRVAWLTWQSGALAWAHATRRPTLLVGNVDWNLHSKHLIKTLEAGETAAALTETGTIPMRFEGTHALNDAEGKLLERFGVAGAWVLCVVIRPDGSHRKFDGPASEIDPAVAAELRGLRVDPSDFSDVDPPAGLEL
jgi:hypothetical protein